MAVLDDARVKVVGIDKVDLDPKGHHLVEGSARVIRQF